jgi:hypothetical protein
MVGIEPLSRFRVHNADLDEQERYWIDQLAQLHRAYQKDAQPIMDVLAEIESRRQYRYVMTTGQA